MAQPSQFFRQRQEGVGIKLFNADMPDQARGPITLAQLARVVLVIAVGLLERKLREAEQLSGEPFPKELELRIKHMIVSHHGEYQYGSPKLPMTLEAIALHLLDNLDAKLYSVAQIMKEDAGGESNWTSYNQALGRKFFKGQTAKE